jgi:hypothetical protein
MRQWLAAHYVRQAQLPNTGHHRGKAPAAAIMLLLVCGMCRQGRHTPNGRAYTLLHTQVAPYIYASLDALALRARRWATHRAQVLAARQPGAVLGGEGAESADLEREGAEAEAAVKKVLVVVVLEGLMAHPHPA